MRPKLKQQNSNLIGKSKLRVLNDEKKNHFLTHRNRDEALRQSRRLEAEIQTQRQKMKALMG